MAFMHLPSWQCMLLPSWLHCVHWKLFLHLFYVTFEKVLSDNRIPSLRGAVLDRTFSLGTQCFFSRVSLCTQLHIALIPMHCKQLGLTPSFYDDPYWINIPIDSHSGATAPKSARASPWESRRNRPPSTPRTQTRPLSSKLLLTGRNLLSRRRELLHRVWDLKSNFLRIYYIQFAVY